MKAIYIPAGPKNLNKLFNIDFREVECYYIEVLDLDGNVIATTPVYQISCCCNDEKVRVLFLSYLGAFDAVNFNKPKIMHDASSTEYQKGLPIPHQYSAGGLTRNNVKANDTSSAINTCYKEANMLWIQELIDSPLAYLEWPGIPDQDIEPDYLPIGVLDKKFEKQKNDKEYNYDFSLEYKMANEVITLRT